MAASRNSLADWLDADGEARTQDTAGPSTSRRWLLAVAVVPWALLALLFIRGGDAPEGAAGSAADEPTVQGAAAPAHSGQDTGQDGGQDPSGGAAATDPDEGSPPGSGEAGTESGAGEAGTESGDGPADPEAHRDQDDAASGDGGQGRTEVGGDDRAAGGAGAARDGVSAAATAAALLAVREQVTVAHDGQRYVDAVHVEDIERHGEVVIIRVVALVLLAEDGVWSEETLERYAVPVSAGGATLAPPWPVPDPALQRDGPVWGHRAEGVEVSAVADALADAGVVVEGELEIAVSPDLPGVLRVSGDAGGAGEVWLEATPPYRLLGAPSAPTRGTVPHTPSAQGEQS